MAVPALSTTAFTQYIASTSNVSASQQAFQSLQQSLAAGNLAAAQSAFNTYRQLNQPLVTAAATSTNVAADSPSASTLSSDMATLGSALVSGSLSSAQSAFTALQSALQTSPPPALANAESAVAQTVQWVDDLLNLSGTTHEPTTNEDPLTSILETAYGLNPSAQNANPATGLLESAYGTGGSDSTTPSAAATPITAPLTSTTTPSSRGNHGSSASVNAYA